MVNGGYLFFICILCARRGAELRILAILIVYHYLYQIGWHCASMSKGSIGEE
jgi:hypothetical protein